METPGASIGMVAPFNRLPFNTAFYASVLLFLLIFSPLILNNTGFNRNLASIYGAGSTEYFQADFDNVVFSAAGEQTPRFEGLRNPRTIVAFQNTFFNTRWALTPLSNRHITLFTHRIPELPVDSQSSHTAKYLILDMPPPAGSAG